MKNSARRIIGGQEDIHPDLIRLVSKHTKKTFLKPIQGHNQAAFKIFLKSIKESSFKRLILDLGAGTGESSYQWALEHSDDYVVSIDRSEVRLNKGVKQKLNNLLYLRTDIEDFIRLFLKEGLKASRTHLFYPNPYPKQSQINKRWYAHPIFESLINSTDFLEVRTNWELYIKEFHLALELFDIKSQVKVYIPEQTVSAFEKKYFLDGQTLYQLVTE